MAAADDVEDLIERFHQALDEFVKGHPEPCKELFSHREDVTLIVRLFVVGRFICEYCSIGVPSVNH